MEGTALADAERKVKAHFPQIGEPYRDYIPDTFFDFWVTFRLLIF